MRYLCAVVLALTLLAPIAMAEPVMEFEGDGLTIRVTSISDDETTLSGELIRGNDRWPFTGRSTGDGDVSTVKGTFQVGKESYPFTATHIESTKTIKFVTDGATYNMKEKVAGANNNNDAPKPPAPPADNRPRADLPPRAKFTTAEFRDINMGNVVAYTMLIPEGFRPEGHIEWSQDKTPYPQTKIKVIGPDNSQIMFQPALTFSYWEASESARRINAQMGGGLPDRQGTPPPAELGKWLVEMGRQHSKDLSNFQMVSDKRDAEAEAAYAAMQAQLPKNPNGGPGTTTIHRIVYTFDQNGVNMTEEVTLTYSRLPPSVTQNMTSYLWMLFTNSCVRAPTAKFAQMRPILYASSSSLQHVPKWFTQSQYLIMEHTVRNHVVGMKEIAERAAFYDKMREEDMAAWRKTQVIGDKQQDARINQIYEVSNFAGPNGSVTKLPSGYHHYWTDGKGGFLMSNSSENPGGEWTPATALGG